MSPLHGFLDVTDGGSLTTIQDGGRPGLAHLGVAPSGFLDVPAAQLANRLVGNPEDAALLETTGRGPTLRLAASGSEALSVAVTGAAVPLRVDDRTADHHAPMVLRVGQALTVGTPSAGIRSYIAVRGGLQVEPVLGSRSTDLLSGLGPPPLQAGQQLPFGPAVGPVPPADVVTVPTVSTRIQLATYVGPRDDWFTSEALRLLFSAEWAVSPTSSRVGLRLQGPRLARRDDAELAPEGMVTGALQVPPDGQPVLLLADHPTTGGYPVIAVVRERDFPLAAQAAPGTAVRFRRQEH